MSIGRIGGAPIGPLEGPEEHAAAISASPVSAPAAPVRGGLPSGRPAIPTAPPPAAASATSSVTVSSVGLSKAAYFERLDGDPALRAKAQADPMGALLDIVAREDVPPSLDREYAKKAGSEGAGRLLLALDYTRGVPKEETWKEALSGGPLHALSSKVISPMLSHFRYLGGASLFPGDEGMTGAFRDSQLWGPRTNQVGHMLCALEAGARMGRLEKHPLEKKAFELALGAANRIAGIHDVKADTADWSRAGIIGHELTGDEDGTGFVGQMKTYGKLVSGGDPQRVRASWDAAVQAVLRGDHEAAWRNVRAIAAAGEVPETAAEVAAAKANPHPKLAAPGSTRDGNSVEDLALSVYAYAIGYRAMKDGLATPEAARDELAAFFAAGGREAGKIDAAAARTRGRDR